MTGNQPLYGASLQRGDRYTILEPDKEGWGERVNALDLLFTELTLIFSTYSPSSLTISARMAGVDLAFLFSSTAHQQKQSLFPIDALHLIIMSFTIVSYLEASVWQCQEGKTLSWQ